jgi:hypothetical protein
MMLLVDEELPGVGLMKGVISGLIEPVVMANFLESTTTNNVTTEPKKLDHFFMKNVLFLKRSSFIAEVAIK